MIEKLKALEAAATPGTLYARGRYLTVRDNISRTIEDIDELGNGPSGKYQAVPFSRYEDAELLAAIRNLAPELIALLEAIQAVDHALQPRGRMWDAFDALNAKAAEVLK